MNHMKQSELGDIVHVSLGTISIWERDVRKPEFGTIERLCELFNVSLAYMLGMNDDPTATGVTNNELAAQYAEEDEMERLRHLTRVMTSLSPSSMDIVAATIVAEYRTDKGRGILQRGYNVKLERFGDEEPEPDI